MSKKNLIFALGNSVNPINMNKIFYIVVATIRVIGEFFSNSPIIKKIAYYMTARTQGGINSRLWIAVVTSVLALLYNVFYLQSEFDHLPTHVPLLFDIYGEIEQWGDKSALSGFTEARIGFFVIMVIIGWVICKVKGGTLKAQRIRLLVIDIANLVITTGVAMAAVYIEIAKGNLEQKLAEEWEYTVMCFWLLILVIEYVMDRNHLVEDDRD